MWREFKDFQTMLQLKEEVIYFRREIMGREEGESGFGWRELMRNGSAVRESCECGKLRQNFVLLETKKLKGA